MLPAQRFSIRVRFQELRAKGELHAINSPKNGPSHLGCHPTDPNTCDLAHPDASDETTCT
jgi:hypothetical protein